mmetsp:Transcript_61073/g.113305  ORF Transcript_61073/g.113305 Transcript_61073/m.113305 type:complete len:250 (+) Transcript_61073:404-1153(+)
MEAEARKLIGDIGRVVIVLVGNGHNHDLPWVEPERPLASIVLGQNGKHSLNAPQDGSVDHDRPLETRLHLLLLPNILLLALGVSVRFCLGLLFPRFLGLLLLCLLLRFTTVLFLLLTLHLITAILQVESNGQLEVQLDGSALVFPPHGISQADVNLGTIEGAITRIQAPVQTRYIEHLLHGSFCRIPDCSFTNGLLRSSGQCHGRIETKLLVDKHQKLQCSKDLLLDLLRAAEDVCIILLEAAHSSKPC